MPSDEAARKIDEYLETLRRSCGKVPPRERDEFIDDIRGHILDRLEADGEGTGSIERIFEQVGDPKRLAAQLPAQRVIERAARAISPWTILHGMCRFALTGVAGTISLLLTVAAYGCTAVAGLVILLKPLFPSRIGLWLGPGERLTLGFWNGHIVHAQTFGITFASPFNFVVMGTIGPADGPVRDLAGGDIYLIALAIACICGVGGTLFARWALSKLGRRKFRGTGGRLASSASVTSSSSSTARC